jgi:hypothetical protein
VFLPRLDVKAIEQTHFKRFDVLAHPIPRRATRKTTDVETASRFLS